MKKLKNKVFFTIFILLSVFSISILLIFNIQAYNNEKVNIENKLIRLNDIRDVTPPDKKLYMDTTIYTAILNNKNKVISVISHNELGVPNNVSLLLENIIKNNRNFKIGNLYFEKYSYSYSPYNKIIIIDNTSVNNQLSLKLRSSIILFICLEVIIIFISYMITKWIIKPVIESFDKQKQFITDASHELKTPLAVIIASSEAFEKDNEEKWLKNIQYEAERMNKLVTNLLDLSKIENNNNNEQLSKNNLSKITEISILSLESLIFEKNIKLEYNIQEDIYFYFDNEEIRQLLTILLDNAIKHSIEDGKIIVDLSKNKNEIILSVSNKGDAIPKGEEEKIFERFYRIDKSRNRNENRYGLGLSIAKSIVLKHDGKIIAFSKDDYTTFKVLFKTKI